MKIKYLIIVVFLFCKSDLTFACPSIDKIPDYNCDGKVIISIIGDSLVKGFGDTKNGNQGGYVLRAEKKLPDIEIINLGVLGLKTLGALDVIKENFKAENDAAKSDYVILDVGRNDRWLFGEPIAAYRNIKRANKLIKKTVKEIYPETPPLVITAVLMLPNRGSQGPWVKDLNSLIFKGSSVANPADLRFDLVSKRLLGDDQIHPTSKGYDALTKTLISYLTKNLPKKVVKLQPDTDGDDIPDKFESLLFGTDPNNPDTDGDGITDSKEIFN